MGNMGDCGGEGGHIMLGIDMGGWPNGAGGCGWANGMAGGKFMGIMVEGTFNISDITKNPNHGIPIMRERKELINTS